MCRRKGKPWIEDYQRIQGIAMAPTPDEPLLHCETLHRPVAPILTVQQHIMREQQRIPGASGEFSWLLSGITLATKMIAARVRQAGLTDVLGEYGRTNVQGEAQQKLDVYANETLLHCLSWRESIGFVASEENERPMAVHYGLPSAKYAVIFDPLDGSSNIDVNVSVGTTFSVLRRPEDGREDVASWVLQPGRVQVAAGYVLYGSSTMLVYSAGAGVHGFTLDPSVGAYVLSHENIRMPAQGRYYSVNEAYYDEFPEPYRRFLSRVRHRELGRRYATRYVGSMVADFHRTLLKGGIFMYPPTAESPSGKLRLLYEANPVAFLAEQAGGVATDGTRRVLDVQPETIHQRTALVVGSQVEMGAFRQCVEQG
jgi:fructose-1,6-bisphosphatase I